MAWHELISILSLCLMLEPISTVFLTLLGGPDGGL